VSGPGSARAPGGSRSRPARIGGDVVERSWGGAENVRAKAPGDWVSEIDIESENAIRAALEREAPGIAFFGEEAVANGPTWAGSSIRSTERRTSSTACTRWESRSGWSQNGRPVVGGRARADAGGDVHRARWRGSLPQRRPAPGERPATRGPRSCATGFPFRRKEILDGYLETFLPIARSIEDFRRIGVPRPWISPGTASGVLDGYFELGLGTWDVARRGPCSCGRPAGSSPTGTGIPNAWLVSGDTIAAPPAIHAHLLAHARAGAQARAQAVAPEGSVNSVDGPERL